MNIITDQTGLVIMFSDGNPTPPAGGSFYTLTNQQEEEFRTLNSSPNGGITYIDGTFTALPVPPPPIPQTASAGDFMKALYELGWYNDVNTVVQQVGGLAEILWNRAAIFERNNALVIQIATAIGKTSQDLDDLFILANSYNQ